MRCRGGFNVVGMRLPAVTPRAHDGQSADSGAKVRWLVLGPAYGGLMGSCSHVPGRASPISQSVIGSHKPTQLSAMASRATASTSSRQMSEHDSCACGGAHQQPDSEAVPQRAARQVRHFQKRRCVDHSGTATSAAAAVLDDGTGREPSGHPGGAAC